MLIRHAYAISLNIKANWLNPRDVVDFNRALSFPEMIGKSYSGIWTAISSDIGLPSSQGFINGRISSYSLFVLFVRSLLLTCFI